MKKYYFTLCFAALYFFAIASSFGQVTRVAVFPFENRDGNMKYNLWSYKLQDSLSKAFVQNDPDELNYHIVPADSVEKMLAEMNLDPTNPQYLSDMWKAVEKLNVQRVVIGNFNIQANRFLINAYIYDPKTKLPNPNYQARDIFKSEDKVYESIAIISKKLRSGVLGNE